MPSHRPDALTPHIHYGPNAAGWLVRATAIFLRGAHFWRRRITPDSAGPTLWGCRGLNWGWASARQNALPSCAVVALAPGVCLIELFKIAMPFFSTWKKETARRGWLDSSRSSPSLPCRDPSWFLAPQDPSASPALGLDCSALSISPGVSLPAFGLCWGVPEGSWKCGD